MALSLGWLLIPGSRVRTMLALALLAGATASSFLALRTSPVSPDAHAGELERIRPLVEDARVLFLGRDDFVGWELRGAEIEGIVTNHFNVDRVPVRYRNPHGSGDKFDIDAVTAKGLRRYDFVVAPNGKPHSRYPAGLEPVALSTGTYTLFRVRRTEPRRTLNEGGEPGLVAECNREGEPQGPLGRLPRSATVSIFARPPVEAGEDVWRPAPVASDGKSTQLDVELEAGIYDVGIAYDSRRPLTLRGPGYEAELPANLDFRGPTPYLPAGTIGIEQSGPVTIEARVERPNLLARALRAPNEAHLRGIAFTSIEPDRPVSPAGACGRYVDYYVP